MSDMRHVYNAYAAIYNPEIKKNLEESRDAFSKMNLNQLNDQDLYEVSEEILEKVFFHHDLDVPTAESLIEAILSDAIDGDKSPLRLGKIERLTEAFAAAFDRVKEKSIRVAKESYTEYLYKKDQLSRLSNNNDLDLPKQRLHNNLVAEDKSVVKNGLLEIIEGKINAGLQAYLDKKKGKKKDDGEDNGNGKSSKGSKPDFLDLDKDGDKKESMKKAAKDKKLKEGMATPESGTGKYYREGKPTAKQLEVRAKQDKIRAASNRGLQYKEEVDNVEEGMLVKVAQGVESGVKKFNKFDDKVTKAVTKKVGKAAKKVGMAALRGTAGAVGGAVKGAFQGAGKGIKKGMREELLASGVFSEHEVTKLIWNEFDTDIEENYRAMRNPEKYKDPDESDKPYHKRSREARMRDPERGINSPAFKKFMADRGMSV